MKKISVGLLSYSRTDLLIETLKQIRSDKFQVTVYLLNNNPDFCILDAVEPHICKGVTLKYFWFNKNLGVAQGRRKLIELCSERHMILLDDDIYVTDFSAICSRVDDEFSDAKVGGIAFHILDHGKGKANRFEIPHKNKKFNLNESQDTYLMIGAGHAVDVNIARNAGNYPDDFGLYGFEEVDLSFRIINAGYKIRYLHNCIIEHKKSPDGRFSNKFVNYLAFVNRTRMAKRHLKLYHFVSCYIVRSLFFLLKTKDVKLFLRASKEIFLDRGKYDKFDMVFYRYISKCNGFIWY
ncbi:glycosyltransferase family 2 protein [Photobacterium sanguinicancri]|uniref:glycosyltransferase family 2 protein n=1 Tax=Photobacterium sanguinicancri TaxID=875932 RepID=UPI0021C29C98|nr:hypothetical protein [Photobacterium sanguinicancri]